MWRRIGVSTDDNRPSHSLNSRRVFILQTRMPGRGARAAFVRRRRIAIPPRPPTRGRSSTRAGRAWGRARRADAQSRRNARSGGGAGPRDSAHAQRLPGRRALRVSNALRRAPSQAGPGRRATRFNASRGSPAASACGAAVIRESIGNLATLVTPIVSISGAMFIS